MDTRDQTSSLAARYATTLEATIREAGLARDVAASRGLDVRARNFDRLIGFLEEQLSPARSGMLPPRKGYGFALTRYTDEYEWGEEGATMLALVRDLQGIWSEQPSE